jgi:hypothetical protein
MYGYPICIQVHVCYYGSHGLCHFGWIWVLVLHASKIDHNSQVRMHSVLGAYCLVCMLDYRFHIDIKASSTLQSLATIFGDGPFPCSM